MGTGELVSGVGAGREGGQVSWRVVVVVVGAGGHTRVGAGELASGGRGGEGGWGSHSRRGRPLAVWEVPGAGAGQGSPRRGTSCVAAPPGTAHGQGRGCQPAAGARERGRGRPGQLWAGRMPCAWRPHRHPTAPGQRRGAWGLSAGSRCAPGGAPSTGCRSGPAQRTAAPSAAVRGGAKGRGGSRSDPGAGGAAGQTQGQGQAAAGWGGQTQRQSGEGGEASGAEAPPVPPRPHLHESCLRRLHLRHLLVESVHAPLAQVLQPRQGAA